MPVAARRPALRCRTALRGLALAGAAAALAVGAPAGRTDRDGAPAGADTGERWRSPVSHAEYRAFRDAATGAKWFEDASGARWGGMDAVLAAESLRLTPIERAVAPALLERMRDPARAADPVDVIVRFRRQPASDASDAAAARHGPKLDDLLTRTRAILSGLAARREALGRPVDPAEDAGLLTDAERADLARFRDEVRATTRTMRREVIDEARAAATADQAGVVARIEGVPGARLLGRSFVLSTVSARLPASEIAGLVADHPEIARVEPALRRRADLNVSVPVTGAPAWWGGGYDGSSSTKVAVLDTGIDSSHPGFASGEVSDEAVFLSSAQSDSSFADDASSTDDFHGHGTHVAGIVGSTDSTYKGMAPGGLLMNAKCGYATSDGYGSLQDPDILDAGDWAASHGADVFNCSFGGADTTDGSSSLTLFFDAIVADLGISVAVSAGNSGSSSGTVGVPADGFNVVTVGNFDDRGTTSLTDDRIASSSSRGPLDDGRRKPDISAPGTNTRSASNDWESAGDWVDKTGTSMAAPHVAGALSLLVDAGVGAYPETLKALLLCNAKNTSPEPTSPDNTWGYGSIDLGAAYTDRAAVAEGSLTSSGPAYAFFRAASLASGKRVTLVWNRRVVSNGSAAPSTYSSPLDLDLYVYEGSDESSRGTSASTLDNVEQVKLTASASAPVVKVLRYSSFPSGLTTQRFSVAAESGSAVSAAAPPHPVCAFTTIPAYVAGSAQFTVAASVTNDGDLAAPTPSVTLTLPVGYSLVSGSLTQTIATVAAGGSGGATWTVRAAGSGSGSREFAVAATCTAFGETFAPSGGAAIQILDADPPWGTVTLAGGAAVSPSATVTAAFAVQDLYSGVADMRLRPSGESWGDWEPFASSVDVTFGGGDGTKTLDAEFRDGVGNVSQTLSDSIVVDTTPPAGTVVVESGAAWVTSPDVTLDFSASDATTGVVDMRFSNDGANWSAWTPYAATASWTLTSGDGAKTVRAQFRDAVGRESAVASDAVGLDTTPPSGSLVVEGDLPATNVADARLTLFYGDGASGVTDVRLSDDGAHWGPWQAVAPSAAFALGPDDGVQSVHAQFRDAAGLVSTPTSDSVLVDRTAPAGTFVLAGGAEYLAPGAALTADLASGDGAGGSGVASFRWSHDGGATWSAWTDAAGGSVALDLPGGFEDTRHEVVGEFRDVAGNVSAQATASIRLLPGEPQDATLATTVKGALDAGGDLDAYRFELLAGDRFDARAAVRTATKKADATVALDLYAPDGTLAVDGRYPATSKKAGIQRFTATATGAWRLVVRGVGADAGDGLTYALKTRIQAAKAAPLSGEAAGTSVAVTFDAAAGRVLTGSVRGATMAQAVLVGPSDASGVVVSLRPHGKGRWSLPTGLVVAQGSGTYVLRLAGDGTTPVSWKLKLGLAKRAKSVAETLP